MQLSNAPNKQTVAFAANGNKNAIPVTTTTRGVASLSAGFPPETMTPQVAGGVPPLGPDMNGVLNNLAANARWSQAGGIYKFDSTFASDSNVGGYPMGALVLSNDGVNVFQSLTDNNTNDPNAALVNWQMLSSGGGGGTTSISTAGGSLTLTGSQVAKPIIAVQGTLTSNASITLPASAGGRWIIVNNTVGNFTLVASAQGTSAPSISIPQGGASYVYCDSSTVLSHVNSELPAVKTLNVSGVATVPLAPIFDNSSNAASTAFVQRAIGNFQGLITLGVGATTNLTASQLGNQIVMQGGTLNLPSVAASPVGGVARVFCTAAGTIVTNGTDVITFNSNPPQNTTSLTVAQGDSIEMVCNGGYWFMVQGSSRMRYMPQFAFSTNAAGYQKLPTGVIIQWGSTTSSSSGYTSTTFPIAFPTGALAFATSVSGNTSVLNGALVNSISNTAFLSAVANTSNAYANGVTINWIAIGY